MRKYSPLFCELSVRLLEKHVDVQIYQLTMEVLDFLNLADSEQSLAGGEVG